MVFRFFIGFFFSMLGLLAQQQPSVDFLTADISVQVHPESKSLSGTVTYTFKVIEGVDSVFLDAHHMNFSEVRLNRKKVGHTVSDEKIVLHHNLKKDKTYTLDLVYECTPKQTVYFIGWSDAVTGNEQVWTQGQGKYTSHWLPSFDDMTEKVQFQMTLTAPKNLRVIANGKLTGSKNASKDEKQWSYSMQEPMSSYLLAFAMGNYNSQALVSESGIPLVNYYYPADSLRVEPTYRYTTRIFDFLEKEIGVAYPWQNYKQVPVKDFLYAGMENTGTTLFSNSFVVDSIAYIDVNYVNVNAHELAHQWFGNLVTETDSENHWLHEGFATYYAYLAEKELFGNDHYYWKLYRSYRRLRQKVEEGEGESLLDAHASSLTFYEKGALALHMLREKVGGANFRKGIQVYLRTFAYKNATVSDFLDIMASTSKTELAQFKNDWLVSTKLPGEALESSLQKGAASLRLLFEMEKRNAAPEKDSLDDVDYWNKTESVHFKRYLISEHAPAISPEIVELAFAADTIPLRQSLVMVDDISKYPKEKVVSLLQDNSYRTIENALLQLWVAYPEDRSQYLEATKSVVGLPNKNVRLLWLTLACLTDGYNGRLTKQYFDELQGYTSSIYSTETRRMAFGYLNEAFGFTDTNLLDLMQATGHHSWQFKKFARALLDVLLKDDVYKERIAGLLKTLEKNKTSYLQNKLD